MEKIQFSRVSAPDEWPSDMKVMRFPFAWMARATAWFLERALGWKRIRIKD